MCLPFEDYIYWKKLCVWLEEKGVNNIGEIVHKYHNGLSNDEFKRGS